MDATSNNHGNYDIIYSRHEKVLFSPDKESRYKDWTALSQLDKPRIIDFKGQQYRLTEKRTRTYTTLERVERGCLGIVASLVAVISLGSLVSFKSVKKLFTKETEKVYFGKVCSGTHLNVVDSALACSTQVSLSDLHEKIDALKKGNKTQRKKAALLERGLIQFSRMGCESNLKTFRLQNPDAFKLSTTNTPRYFEQTLNRNEVEVTTTQSFYDYQSTDAQFEDYWVDFANAALGGGCFTHGFVQEEVMVHEMPDFAAHIAENLHDNSHLCKISTREGDSNNRDGVMKGSPNPYLLKGLHRVQAVDTRKAYGARLASLPMETLLESTKALDPPQKVNVLAIAAPRLPNNKPSTQWNVQTLQDNFNTLMAGFTLVKGQYQDEQGKNFENFKAPIIHSGRLGCGVFNNDEHAIYLLHCLASKHLGVAIQLHGYEEENSAKYRQSWEAIAPQLENLSLKECIEKISEHLLNNYQKT
jgi:hypothetical protein